MIAMRRPKPRRRPAGRHYKRSQPLRALRKAGVGLWRWLAAVDEYPRWLFIMYLALASQGLGYLICTWTGWELVRA